MPSKTIKWSSKIFKELKENLTTNQPTVAFECQKGLQRSQGKEKSQKRSKWQERLNSKINKQEAVVAIIFARLSHLFFKVLFLDSKMFSLRRLREVSLCQECRGSMASKVVCVKRDARIALADFKTTKKWSRIKYQPEQLRI